MKYFSKTKAREYAIQMADIEKFCQENAIHSSGSLDSFYFVVNGTSYRVSNHTIEASNRGAYDELFQKIRDCYHNVELEKDVVKITASKLRLPEIYNALVAGKKLNKRGYEI